MNEMINEANLIEKAKEAAENSYAPYSRFRVGAALLSKSGKIYTGCNVENAAYPAACCAERTALFKAVSEGEREFEAISVIGGKELDFCDFCPPCGICRQVLSEFCGENFKIILWKSTEETKTFTLGELLPESFNLKGE